MFDYNKTISNPTAAALKEFGRSFIMQRAWAIFKTFTFKGNFASALKAAWAECAKKVTRWATAEKKSDAQMAEVKSPAGQRKILKAYGRDSYRYGAACMGR